MFSFHINDKKLNFRASCITGALTFVGLELNSVLVPTSIYSSIRVYIDKNTQPDELIYGSYNYKNDRTLWHQAAIITTEELSDNLPEFERNDKLTEKVKAIANSYLRR